MLKLISVLYTGYRVLGVRRLWRHIWRGSRKVWRSVTKGEGGNFSPKSRDVIYGRPLTLTLTLILAQILALILTLLLTLTLTLTLTLSLILTLTVLLHVGIIFRCDKFSTTPVPRTIQLSRGNRIQAPVGRLARSLAGPNLLSVIRRAGVFRTTSTTSEVLQLR